MLDHVLRFVRPATASRAQSMRALQNARPPASAQLVEPIQPGAVGLGPPTLQDVVTGAHASGVYIESLRVETETEDDESTDEEDHTLDGPGFNGVVHDVQPELRSRSDGRNTPSIDQTASVESQADIEPPSLQVTSPAHVISDTRRSRRRRQLTTRARESNTVEDQAEFNLRAVQHDTKGPEIHTGKMLDGKGDDAQERQIGGAHEQSGVRWRTSST
ncbi:hypothetical protein PHYPSEUDO_005769 [Phytophthora pseudosyringae]|uniref:Uncharacterized protein n=1 Tax=Phytophthora pseudosyringae TaxID=221518 RepID=A0A8T1VNM1_9STRA|nr:hypothetical protein PHYPSEUDO_005769 [Phytophthora pseudosyringae]